MKPFNYLLNELINDNCEQLYGLNQYVLKRFFEYIFVNEDYKEKIEISTGFVSKSNRYNQNHEGILMVSCITALGNNSFNPKFFRTLYVEYLEYKIRSWRGRTDWNDFHKTIFSHFIWSNNENNFDWTWKIMNRYIGKFKNQSSRICEISDWRRTWYKDYMIKLKKYILQATLLSDNINILHFFIKSKILNYKLVSFNKTLKEYGYSYINGDIVLSSFVNDNEWLWIQGEYKDDISGLDTTKLIKLCNEMPMYKFKINVYFKELPPSNFWVKLVNLDETSFKTISKIDFKSTLNYDIKQSLVNNVKGYERKLISLLFNNYKILNINFVNFIKECMNGYFLNVHEGVLLIREIIKTNDTDDYEYLRELCSLFINNKDNKFTCIQTSVNESYWIYSLMGISTNIADIFNIKEDECPICINPLKSKKTEKLICGHTFHRDCLLTDLKKRGTHNLYNCPMCRSKIHPNLIHHIN
tara:strand:- start:14433 stop:15842 length:1410 start_codon:yes stop_codon:yes gene_type:complete